VSTTPTTPPENGSLPVSEAAPKSPGILKPKPSQGRHERQSAHLDAAKALTARQKLFALEYPIDLNGTQAAIRAGYSARTAEAAASRLLRNVKVGAEIRRVMDERAKRLEISADNVLRELAKLAFSNIDDFLVIHEDGTAHFDLSKADRDQRAAITRYVVDEFTEGTGEEARKVRRTASISRTKVPTWSVSASI
jgi:phage terminase small subunit